MVDNAGLLQLCQRVKDVRSVVDLFHLLNEGGTIKNMMPNDYDFRQFQVSLCTPPV